MHKITDFSRRDHTMLSQAIIDHLEELGDECGVRFVEKGGNYGGGSLTIKIEVKPADDALVARQESQKFAARCHHYGLQPEHYGTVIQARGSSWRVFAFAPRSPKYPILAREVGSDRVLKLSRGHVPLIINQYENQQGAGE